jgi:hypothetical protein
MAEATFHRAPTVRAAAHPQVRLPRLLIVIIIGAMLVRLASAVYQGNTVAPLPGIYDQLSYDGLARRLIDGHGFRFATEHWPATRAGEPTAHWSYLYTLYLAGVYTLFGPQPVIARLIQALIAGFLHSWLAWRLGRRLFGPTIGLVAAGLSAGYAYFVYYAGGLLTETFYILGILWVFDVAFRLASHPLHAAGQMQPTRWRLWAELGLAIGSTVLLRQLFLLFVPFLYGWLWWNVPAPPSTPGNTNPPAQRRRWGTIQGLIGVTLILMALIAPWTLRNYRAFGTWTPLNTNAGFAFFWGNHPIYGTTFVGILPGEQAYQALIPPELRSLNEAQLDQALLKRGIGFIVDDPLRYLLLSLSRTREYFKFWPSAESGTISNLARVASFGLLWPLMLYGLLRSLPLLRKPTLAGQRAALMLCALFIIVYSAIHLLTWALIRYRLPVDAILLIFAAFGVVQLATVVGRWRRVGGV